MLNLILSLLLFLTVSVFAHDLQHSVKKVDDTVVISFYFPDGTKFSYENFEIYRDGEKIPFQVGRTDALGRVVFVPDKEGNWSVKIFSEDGHGSTVKVSVEKAGYVSLDEGVFKRYEKVFVGIGLILGIFGFISIFKCGRSVR
ncbi:hypothetical protein [Sulfurihydrogenibium subterraneum]|uniref:hypothetical protein n=1 Tax=Sulfurihydrogenibium subterraneum TaxID=171121 RepID=UPI00048EB146|nr:hypothetical protein [Sulfurihydrogenibium subterraneum]